MHVQGEKLKFHLSTARQAAMRDWCLTYLYLWYKLVTSEKKKQASCGSGKKSFVVYSQRGSRSSKRENKKKIFSAETEKLSTRNMVGSKKLTVSGPSAG